MPFLLLAFVVARTIAGYKLPALTNEHWGEPALIPVVQIPAPGLSRIDSDHIYSMCYFLAFVGSVAQYAFVSRGNGPE